MKVRIALSFALIVALSAQFHAQADLKVPQQFATIQNAVDWAVPGDVLTVSEGTYEPFNVVARMDLKVRGKGKVVIDATGTHYGILVAFSQGIVLSNLRVRDAMLEGIRIDTAEVVVRHCRIRDCGSDGIYATLADDSLLVSNRITDVAGQGINIESDAVTARKNRVTNPTKCGIFLVGDLCTLRDNEINDPSGVGINVGTYLDEVHDNLIEGNIIRGASTGISHKMGSSCSILDNRIVKSHSTGIELAEDVQVPVVRDNRVNSPAQHGLSVKCKSGDFRDNEVKNPAEHGFLIDSEAGGCVFRRNKVDSANSRGFFIHGANNTFGRNRILKSGGQGIVVYGASNTFIRNRVLKSAGHGIRVASKANLFRENVAKLNAGYDLVDVMGPGDNTYIDNDFGTTLP